MRSGRRIQITPTGEALLQLSHRLFADIRETASTIGHRHQTLSGILTLGGGMTVCLYVFPPLVSEYRQAYPDVEIKVVTGGTPRLLRKLRAAAIDLALLTLPIDDRELRVEPVWREEMLLVLPPTHRLARGAQPISPTELAHEPFISFESGSNTRRVIDEFFARERIQPPVVTETGNVEITKAMVAAGLGVSIVPYQSIARETASGRLRFARVAGPPLVRATGWVYLRSGRVPADGAVDDADADAGRAAPAPHAGYRARYGRKTVVQSGRRSVNVAIEPRDQLPPVGEHGRVIGRVGEQPASAEDPPDRGGIL